MSWKEIVFEAGGDGAYPLCPRCIEAIRSRGERIFVGNFIMSAEELEEDWADDPDAVCEFCGEKDDLYACLD